LLLRARRPGIYYQTDSLCDSALNSTFISQLNIHLFTKHWWDVLSALEIFLKMRYINWHYLLTGSLLTGSLSIYLFIYLSICLSLFVQ